MGGYENASGKWFAVKTPKNKLKTRMNRGMTLLEVVISIAIFVVTLLWSFNGIFTGVAANRAASRQLSANSVIAAQLEQIQSIANEVARSAATEAGDLLELRGERAQAVLKFYANDLAVIDATHDDNGIALGPNGTIVPRVSIDNGAGTLVYRFAVPAPGKPLRSTGGSAEPGTTEIYGSGFGEILIYLNETTIPPENLVWLGQESHEAVLWESLEGPVEKVGKEYDLNGDGVIAAANSGIYSAADVMEPKDLGMTFAVLDILVHYFDSPAHEREVTTVGQRVLITGTFDAPSSGGDFLEKTP